MLTHWSSDRPKDRLRLSHLKFSTQTFLQQSEPLPMQRCTPERDFDFDGSFSRPPKKAYLLLLPIWNYVVEAHARPAGCLIPTHDIPDCRPKPILSQPRLLVIRYKTTRIVIPVEAAGILGGSHRRDSVVYDVP